MRRAVGLAGNPAPSGAPAEDPQLDRDALEAHFLGNTAEYWELWAVQNDLPIVAIRPPSEQIVR